jgi:hypothetical protein
VIKVTKSLPGPIAAIGTEQGWHYTYPIHEWPINRITHYQGEAPRVDSDQSQLHCEVLAADGHT